MRQLTPILMLLAAGAQGQVTTFDNGTNGWRINGDSFIAAEGGNPGAHLDGFIFSAVAMTVRNTTEPFIGDYRGRGNMQFTIDLRVDSINFAGTEVERPFAVEIRAFNINGTGINAQIFAPLTDIGTFRPGWETFTASLDTDSGSIPFGWFGGGSFDDFGPTLPEGITVDDVLGNVSELAFTTFVPGFFFGSAQFDFGVDNVGIVQVPAPSAALTLTGVLAVAARRRR